MSPNLNGLSHFPGGTHVEVSWGARQHQMPNAGLTQSLEIIYIDAKLFVSPYRVCVISKSCFLMEFNFVHISGKQRHVMVHT